MQNRAIKVARSSIQMDTKTLLSAVLCQLVAGICGINSTALATIIYEKMHFSTPCRLTKLHFRPCGFQKLLFELIVVEDDIIGTEVLIRNESPMIEM